MKRTGYTARWEDPNPSAAPTPELIALVRAMGRAAARIEMDKAAKKGKQAMKVTKAEAEPMASIKSDEHSTQDAFSPSTSVLKVSKVEAARRQTEAAIDALEKGNFDIAITLAAAAEGMLPDDAGVALWPTMKDNPKAIAIFKSPKRWADILNQDVHWLKHQTKDYPSALEFTAEGASFVVARAISKLDPWSERMKDFSVWFLREIVDKED